MSVKFYNDNVESFFNQTVKADMSYLYSKFLEKLPQNNGKILDLGCGSGRDSKYFKNLGFEVVALDMSEELAKRAGEYIGQEVIVKDMRELNFHNEFVGVWACASILHIPIEEVKVVFEKVFESLKNGGIFYSSFKYGEKDYLKDGREFTCFTPERFFQYFPQYKENIVEIFETSDVREGREGEKWFNIIMRKTG
ncbi:tellurite resistance protein TehB [Fusobacterium necrogenes]|uniref:Tellurite resistance protein TehB n=1 Tax=Fusobacterium necrogenes TaxID=858 RepID=A0A377GWS9_9FUSO|nr:class I SAM-dependent methyltransferase [Fusobacterium necrogenes]STO31222.1 tellurite resistance protein TehB [Fusobacterium necrogenes]